MSYYKQFAFSLIVATALVTFFPCIVSATWFVDSSALGANDGTSWADAFVDLQDALASVSPNEEIWVARGTYYPDRGSAGIAFAINNDPGSTFGLENGIGVYGGFDGTELSRAARDPAANLTVLSGDIDGNDATNFFGVLTNAHDHFYSPYYTNAWHVVTCPSYVTTPPTLDGFTITAGWASDDSPQPDGAGLFINGPIHLRQCTIIGNLAYAFGGGASFQSDADVSNCLFIANDAGRGGGFASSSNSIRVTDSQILDNDGFLGGGIWSESAVLTISRTIISGNGAPGAGGGMMVRGGGAVTRMLNCLVSGNYAEYYTGGAELGGDRVDLVNCTFSGNNTFLGSSCALGLGNVSGLIVNSVIWSNKVYGGTSIGASVLSAAGTNVVFRHCLIANSGGSGAWKPVIGLDGGNNVDTNALFVDPVLNYFMTTNGNFSLRARSAARNVGDNDADIDGTGPATSTIADELTDLAGKPRVNNGTVDLGAYETTFASTVWYVDASAVGANDGTSWEDAFVDLQDALVSASADADIWVAAGTYYPDRASAGIASVTNNNRYSTFMLKNNLGLYGGFDGTEAAREDRDPTANLSVLSGDIDFNDVTNSFGVRTSNLEVFRDSNAWHVVTCPSSVTTPPTVDGFTVTAGRAIRGPTDSHTEHGAGLFINGPINISQCVIIGNRAYSFGGGICTATNSISVTDCQILNNFSEQAGGGIFNGSAVLTVSRTIISGNGTWGAGGGLNTFGDGTVARIRNCLVSNNGAEYFGGGASFGGRVDVVNCTFSGNFSYFSSPVLALGEDTSGLIVNSVFWGNATGAGSSGMGGSGTNVVFTHCLVANSGGSASWNPQVGKDGGTNIDTNALFVDPSTGNFRLQGISPARNIGNNSADIDGTGPATTTIAQESGDLVGEPRVSNGIVDLGAYESADSDNEGLSDWEEQNLYGTDRNDADSDDDGVGDWSETRAGSNPGDPASRLEFTATEFSDGVVLTWESASNRTYRLEASTGLTSGVWFEITNGIPATPPLNMFSNTPAILPVYYRILLQ